MILHEREFFLALLVARLTHSPLGKISYICIYAMYIYIVHQGKLEEALSLYIYTHILRRARCAIGRACDERVFDRRARRGKCLPHVRRADDDCAMRSRDLLGSTQSRTYIYSILYNHIALTFECGAGQMNLLWRRFADAVCWVVFFWFRARLFRRAPVVRLCAAMMRR